MSGGHLVHHVTFLLFSTKCSFNLVAPSPRNSFTQYLHLTQEINSLYAPTLHPSPPSISAIMDGTKQIYHKNSCQARHIRPSSRIPERLVGYVWPPIRTCPDFWRNRLNDLPVDLSARTADFGRFPPAAIDFLAGRPTVARLARSPVESGRFSPRRRGFLQPPTRPRVRSGLLTLSPITAQFRPVFAPPPSISALSDRLRLLSRPEQMGNEEFTLLPSRRDRIPYTWVVGQVGPFLSFWFNLNFIQQNGRDLKKILHQCS
jgi:hypothetical protein